MSHQYIFFTLDGCRWKLTATSTFAGVPVLSVTERNDDDSAIGTPTLLYMLLTTPAATRFGSDLRAMQIQKLWCRKKCGHCE